jgi:predicted ATP-grasp superfamily ATP-dependent carboligase
MTRSVLLTLGRLPKGLDLARSFARHGWRVVVAEPSRDHLSRASRAVAKSIVTPSPVADRKAYSQALLEIVVREQIDLILPVSEEILYVTEAMARWKQPVEIFAMPHGAVKRAHDKLLFVRWLEELGLKAPPTAALGTPEAAALLREMDCVVKPRHACAGQDVTFHKAGETVSRGDGFIVQKRIDGFEASTCSLAYHGDVIGTAIYYPMMKNGSVSIAFETMVDRSIPIYIQKFVKATGWHGFISFDFIRDGDSDFFAIECNPRTTSGLHCFKTDDIAPSVLGERQSIRFQPYLRFKQFWSVAEELKNSLGQKSRFREVHGVMMSTRDVTWRRDDPWPSLTLPWMAREIVARARREQIPFGIAAMRDLVWTEDASSAHHDATLGS